MTLKLKWQQVLVGVSKYEIRILHKRRMHHQKANKFCKPALACHVNSYQAFRGVFSGLFSVLFEKNVKHKWQKKKTVFQRRLCLVKSQSSVSFFRLEVHREKSWWHTQSTANQISECTLLLKAFMSLWNQHSCVWTLLLRELDSKVSEFHSQWNGF